MARRGRRTLGPFTVTVEPAEVVALVGPNGAGKTTLLRLLLGIDRPSSGLALVGGCPVGPLTPPRGVGYVPDRDEFWDWLSAEQNLWPFAPDPAAVTSTIVRVGLDPSSAPVRTYSRGMRQRLAIARALLTATGLLVLDEPTIAIDSDGVALLAGVVGELRLSGVATLVATHDADFAGTIGARLVRVEAGRTE